MHTGFGKPLMAAEFPNHPITHPIRPPNPTLEDTPLYRTGHILQSSCPTQQHVMVMLMVPRMVPRKVDHTQATTNWTVLPTHLRLVCLQYLPVCKRELVWYDVPDTAQVSYRGSFVTDVHDPASTVKQPDHLHFSEATYRVLQQVHPGLKIDLGALYVCEDYQRYVVQILVDQAANLMTTQSVHTSLDTFAKRQESLGEKATWPTFEWHIVGQEDNFFYLEIDADHDVNEEPTWKPRSFVERVLPAQLKSWDLFDPAKKAAVFQAWLQQQRTKRDASFWFPRQIYARHIQTAVRMLIPGELSKHGMAVMLTATTIASRNLLLQLLLLLLLLLLLQL